MTVCGSAGESRRFKLGASLLGGSTAKRCLRYARSAPCAILRYRGSASIDQLIIDLLIIDRHHFSRETRLEFLAAGGSREIANFPYAIDQIIHGRSHKPGHAVPQNLGHRTTRPGNYRRPAREGFDHHETEWLRPVNREKQRQRSAKKFVFLFIIYFADKLHSRMR